PCLAPFAEALPVTSADERAPGPRVHLVPRERFLVLLELRSAKRLGAGGSFEQMPVEARDEGLRERVRRDLPERRDHGARTGDVKRLDETGRALAEGDVAQCALTRRQRHELCRVE